jgi:two-component system sensor kinase FixL
VRDNGPGIPAEIKDKLLTTYFTTKPQGTGLGLGICNTLIKEHFGHFKIQEHDGPGAWFMFTLPIRLPCQIK